jgi:hypothetical protein
LEAVVQVTSGSYVKADECGVGHSSGVSALAHCEVVMKQINQTDYLLSRGMNVHFGITTILEPRDVISATSKEQLRRLLLAKFENDMMALAEKAWSERMKDERPA